MKLQPNYKEIIVNKTHSIFSLQKKTSLLLNCYKNRIQNIYFELHSIII